MNLSASVGQRLAAVVGVVAAAGLYAAAFSAETPVGGLTARITAKDTGKPLVGIRVVVRPQTPESGDDARLLRTDSDGRVSVARLPAGEYEIEPQTNAHDNTAKQVLIQEGQPVSEELSLKPNDPYFSLNIHQHAYLPDQDPRIAYNGFRQGEAIQLELFSIDRAALLRDYGGNLRTLLSPISSSGGPATLKALQDRRFKSLRQWSEPVQKPDAEGVFYNFVQLGKQRPGVYLVAARGAKNAAYGWLMVTDLALVTKSAEGRVIALTTDLKTGKALPGVPVTITQGSSVQKGTTAASGVAEFKFTAKSDQGANAIAIRGESLAFNDFNPFGYWETRRYRVFTYTDRPVYRPGHKVRFKGVVRRLERVGYSVPSVRSATLELRDPEGTSFYTEHVTLNEHGGFAGDLELNPEVRSGLYSMVTKIEGEEYTSDFAVASYRKPEWKVDVRPEKRTYVTGETVPVSVQATYYFGSPVVNGTVRYTVYKSPHYSYWYDDEDPTVSWEEETEGDYGSVVAEGEARTDADGVASFQFSTKDDPAEGLDPGDGGDIFGEAQEFDFRIECEVADISGRAASGTGSVRVAAGELSLTATPSRYVAAPGETTDIECRVTDLEDKPVAGVEVSMEAVLSVWTGLKSQEQIIATKTLSTDAKGTLTFPFQTNETGLVFVRAKAKDRRGNPVSASADVWISSDDGGDLETRYPNLSVQPDKKHYKVGETAQFLINTDKPGATALVAVEAERVLEYKLVTLKRKSTVVPFIVRAGYEPNVFVTACFVQNREFTTSQARLNVAAGMHRLKVTVTADREVYKPRESATFQITTQNAAGKPVAADVSFGVVDEAIYAVREEPKQGIWEAFYPRRQNQVSTQFSYPDIYLGDADKDGAGAQVRREFPDTAYWEPFVRTDASGKATVRVTLPDSLTSWRATATAITDSTSVGKTTANIRVMKDLTLRLQVPRSLTEGDTLSLTAVAHNYSQGPLDVNVKLNASGITLKGDATRKVRLDPGEAETVGWEAVADTPGGATVTATATAGSLSDGMELKVPVRSFTRQKIEQKAGSVSDAIVTETLSRDGEAVEGEAEIRVSPTLSGALLGSLDYLATYPYGCTEQTMSSFLPDVVVLQTLNGLGLEQADLRAKLPEMATAGLLRLSRYQHYDGGWGWWEHDANDPWMTAYVVFGLGLAKDAGVTVNPNMLSSGVNALVQVADSKELTDNQAMFVAYVLTRHQNIAKARTLLNRLGDPKKKGKLQTRSLAYAALALANAGERKKAHSLLEELWSKAVTRDGMTLWQEDRTSTRWDEFGHGGIPSDLESTAMVLKLAVTLTPDEPRLREIVRALLLKRQGNKWDSTRDTAFILFALADYLKVTQELQPDYHLTVTVNGKQLLSQQIGTDAVGKPEIVLTVPFADLAASNKIEFSKDGAGVAYYSVRLTQGIKSATFAPETPEPGLTLTREYFRMETKRDPDGRPIIAPADKPTDRFQVGDRVMVRLRVRTPRTLDYIMVEDPLPSGFEVQERGDIARDEWDRWWSYTDPRDDRVLLFARSIEKDRTPDPKEKNPAPPGQVFEYYLRPEITGTVRALPAVLSDMYVPSLRASTSEAKLEVR